MKQRNNISQTREPAIHKKTDGFLLIYPDSQVRFLGFWEGMKHRFFGWSAQDFIDEETGAEVFREILR
jgi:hypothetical protein